MLYNNNKNEKGNIVMKCSCFAEMVPEPSKSHSALSCLCSRQEISVNIADQTVSDEHALHNLVMPRCICYRTLLTALFRPQR
jgi:hypothetical protein